MSVSEFVREQGRCRELDLEMGIEEEDMVFVSDRNGRSSPVVDAVLQSYRVADLRYPPLLRV